jgi:acyl-coenzyme A synthetase/AMP-(fatty) acid ligase
MNAEKRPDAALRKPVPARIVEHVAKWRLPDDVMLIERLPMTASGKIGKERTCARSSAISCSSAPGRRFRASLDAVAEVR